MIEGLVWSRPSLLKLHDHNVVVRRDMAEDAALRDQRVALVSADMNPPMPVAGDVFTSPAPDAIVAAIKAVTGSKGCLLIVKNYTGDRLNFGLAAEIARSEGLQVNIVTWLDDVALASDDSATGRRGIAGTVLVHKLAGAAAEEGKSLEEVTRVARRVAENVRTMGVALSPCIVPAVGKPTFTLPPNEVELGLGIHGEAGVRKQPLESADATADQLLTAILADAKLAEKSRVAAMVNNLGATTSMELYIVARRVLRFLEEKGFVVERLLVGTYMTALEMAGLSVSLLPIDDEALSLLDAPAAHDAAWHGFSRAAPSRKHAYTAAPPATSAASAAPSPSPDAAHLVDVVEQVIAAVLQHEELLTQLDQQTGDGDFGVTLARGGKAVRAKLADLRTAGSVADALHALGMELQRSMGGTSGALYGVFFLRMSDALRKAPTGHQWAEALKAGTDAIGHLGGAKLGTALAAAAEAARKGAESTSELVRRKGRGTYLGERAKGHKDAGAEAVALLLDALLHTLRPSTSSSS
ncbi:glycerone kinase [Acanthamoeba castellanii str. Neff]|uniref:Glycerone kinase n=1 Tax=Acanthamoeba castellanii (strain ATCC 30010 / Neff) TaxID=1257118 RepID=L8GH20_ACACF|nr:glycerone kinase [Acanthamoeba castellanii str. Neff]ELR12395.1 glycerone kinase [Acanthamoeba castellanii str. Neff]